MNPTDLIPVFRRHFLREPELASLAPGRVNILGEHTDYNDGFVFPAAIDRGVGVVAGRRTDRTVRAYSVSFQQSDSFHLDHLQKSIDAPWSNYLRGVFQQFMGAGFEPSGLDLVIDGDVPVGAGLSSSAAVEVATAVTLRDLFDFQLDGPRLALLCQAAEREFVGVSCGIMDQFISTLAQENRALLIDCRNLAYRAVSLDPQITLIVCDTRVQRSLDGSAYNQRRRECEEAVSLLRPALGPIRALRDVTSVELAAHAQLLPEPVLSRARHVVGENERVNTGIELLDRNDMEGFGRLLYLSHESLQRDFEVSCRELDVLVELASRQPGTVGARMTGAGFGGCTVNLVRASEADDWIPRVRAGYLRLIGHPCEVYACRAAAGARSFRL
jgi:galactokinase